MTQCLEFPQYGLHLQTVDNTPFFPLVTFVKYFVTGMRKSSLSPAQCQAFPYVLSRVNLMSSVNQTGKSESHNLGRLPKAISH